MLLPLVLYRIHLATTRLVMESNTLADWVMIRSTSPQQLVVPSTQNTSREVQSNSTTTQQPAVYTLHCEPDKIIHKIIQDKLKQVGISLLDQLILE